MASLAAVAPSTNGGHEAPSTSRSFSKVPQKSNSFGNKLAPVSRNTRPISVHAAPDLAMSPCPSIEASAGCTFHAFVNSCLAALGHELTSEFERVRRHDLARIQLLERQVISCGGSLETPEIVDLTRKALPGDGISGKGKSVEAYLDAVVDLPTTHRLSGVPSLSGVPTMGTTQSLPTSRSTMGTTQSLQMRMYGDGHATGSASNRLPRSTQPHLSEQDLSRPHMVNNSHVTQDSAASPVMNPTSNSSELASIEGPPWQPEKPETIHPKGPGMAPPFLKLRSSHATSHDMLEPSNNGTCTYSESDLVISEMGKMANVEVTRTGTIQGTNSGDANDKEALAPQTMALHAPGERQSDSEVEQTCTCDGELSKEENVTNLEPFSVNAWSNQSKPTLSDSAVSDGDVSSAKANQKAQRAQKSCRFNEDAFDTVHLVQHAHDDDDESDDDVNGDRRTRFQSEADPSSSRGIAASTVRNSLEQGQRFPLLPIWLDKAHSKRMATTPLHQAQQHSQQMQQLMDDGLCDFDEADTEDRPHTLGDTLAAYVMNPTRGMRMAWDVVAVCLILYECVVIPLQYIDFPQTTGLVIIGWIIRVFWTIDLPLSFMTGYVLDDGTHEMRPAAIAKNYFFSWFLLDLMMVVADWFEALMSSLHVLGGARSVKMLKTLRLCRMVRVVRFFRFKKLPPIVETVMESFFKPEVIPVIFSFVKVVCVFAWLNHFMACLWVKLGEAEYDQKSWIVGHEFVGESKVYIYACAYHWSLQQFAGAAEVWPWNEPERNFAVATGVLTFVGSVMFVSSLTSSMTHLEIVTSQDSRRLAQLKQWLYECGISNTVAVRVQRNAQHALKEEKKNMPESSIELLPTISEPLRMEIHHDMHMQILATHTFFRLSNETSSWMMRRVCHDAIDSLMLSRGDMLFCSGEISQHPRMYFIKSGWLQYSHETGRREEVVDGAWASEGGLWTFWTHCGGMLATSDCRLLSLDVSRFQNLTGQFSRQREFGKRYGQLYVDHLNSCQPADLTDLEDPEMDIEWLAMQSCPGAELSKQSGLLAKMLRHSGGGMRSSLAGARGSGFMGKKHSTTKQSMAKTSRAVSKQGTNQSFGEEVGRKRTWRRHFSEKLSVFGGKKKTLRFE